MGCQYISDANSTTFLDIKFNRFYNISFNFHIAYYLFHHMTTISFCVSSAVSTKWIHTAGMEKHASLCISLAICENVRFGTYYSVIYKCKFTTFLWKIAIHKLYLLFSVYTKVVWYMDRIQLVTWKKERKRFAPKMHCVISCSWFSNSIQHI